MAANHYFKEYYLDNDGNVHEVNCVTYTPLKELGPECEQTYDEYEVRLANAKKYYYTLHCEPSGNVADNDTKGLHPMDPQTLFGDY